MKLAQVAIAAAVILPAATAAQMPAPSTSEFLKKAAASDLFEREEGKLMSSSAKPDIKMFAQHMVRDHTKSSADIKAAARVAHMTVAPPRLDAEQSRNLAALRAARGAERDRLYIDQQKQAHNDALALMEAYSKDGRAAPLRVAAGKIAPVVRMHISMLDKM
jgi:putative membrane protein